MHELDVFRSDFWKPSREFSELQKGINRLFEGFPTTRGYQNAPTEFSWAPACDVEETATRYQLMFDLPGMSKENIKVELNDRDLLITGERKEEKSDDKKARHVIERCIGRFRRVFVLPQTVTPEQIQASFDNGVLKITVLKVAETKTRQIKIGDGKALEMARPAAKAG